MDEDFIKDAKEELKRADHLIYVSIKYTRTVDIIKHIIERFINFIDILFEAILTMEQEENKIPDIPAAPAARANLIKKQFHDDSFLVGMANFYLKLRLINRASFERDQEFRRHVKMTAHLDSEEKIEINIDIITDYFKKMKEFMEYVEQKFEQT